MYHQLGLILPMNISSINRASEKVFLGVSGPISRKVQEILKIYWDMQGSRCSGVVGIEPHNYPLLSCPPLNIRTPQLQKPISISPPTKTTFNPPPPRLFAKHSASGKIWFAFPSGHDVLRGILQFLSTTIKEMFTVKYLYFLPLII